MPGPPQGPTRIAKVFILLERLGLEVTPSFLQEGQYMSDVFSGSAAIYDQLIHYIHLV